MQSRLTNALKKLLAKAKAEAQGSKDRLMIAVEEQRELREELAGQTQRWVSVVFAKGGGSLLALKWIKVH